MDRRHLLRAAAAAALLPLGATARARPARSADFATAVAAHPIYAPFRGVDDTSGNIDGEALVRGRWPEALRGRFHRNGPALYERGGERYHHWFDGDGMVQQYTIADGRVRHRGRLVRTAKLASEQRAGRFLVSAVGTHVDGGLPAGGPDHFNAANTNALEHGGRLLALWEGGSAYALDPRDLSTIGPVTWRPDLKQVPFSAHPKVDAQGHLWNIGTFGPSIVLWHIDPQGRLVDVQVGESPYPGGMVHDMAVTERHVVVPLPPVSFRIERPVEGPRRFALEAGQPLRILVAEKADLARRRVFELPAEMVFHVGNAHEDRLGNIVLSYVGAPDAWSLDQGAVAVMSARPARGSVARVAIATLDLASGRAQVRAQQVGNAEFPRIDPRLNGLPARGLLMASGWRGDADHQGAFRHGVQWLDTDSGRLDRYDYGEQMIVEEHIVVPRPGGRGERDGWLLGTTYDARRDATVLNLLDAAHIADGPVAQAVLPYRLPLGFHGNWAPG